MLRIYVICEGLTEEAFVRDVLAEYYHQEMNIQPILIGKVSERGKGGDVRYARLRPDLLRLLRQDRGAACTTMVDFYRLGHDFPGFPVRDGLRTFEKAEIIECSMSDDICRELGTSFDSARFIPYIQMHEFEGLLFSDPEQFARGIYRPDLEAAMKDIRCQFETPEDIDDGAETAPSKRVLARYPGYDKVTEGAVAAISIGLDKMRAECPHFAGWLGKLEALA